jgi:hypothetical protein
VATVVWVRARPLPRKCCWNVSGPVTVLACLACLGVYYAATDGVLAAATAAIWLGREAALAVFAAGLGAALLLAAALMRSVRTLAAVAACWRS